jgi:hypothetical protein
VLSGAAVALAMQVGLHLTGSGQDFSRTKLDSSRARMVNRAQLWMHCLMILHRYVSEQRPLGACASTAYTDLSSSTKIQEGISPFLLVDPSALNLDDESLDAEFAAEVRVRRKMYSVLTSSRAAIVRILPSAADVTHPNALRSIIAISDSKLLALAGQITDPKGRARHIGLFDT